MDALVTIGAVIIGGVITAVITWLYGRTDTRRRNRIDYLVSAFHSLQSATERPLNQELARDMEAAMDKIFLFGTAEQIRLADEFAGEYARERTASLRPLLLSLRSHLRRELGLPRDERDRVPALRITLDAPKGQGLSKRKSR